MLKTDTRQNGLLYPFLIAASAVAVILTLMAIAALTGRFPGALAAGAAAEAVSGPVENVSAANLIAHRPDWTAQCSDCGMVEAVRRIDLRLAGRQSQLREDSLAPWLGQDDAIQGTIWRVQVRMETGRLRTVSLDESPALHVGDRVRLVASDLIRVA